MTAYEEERIREARAAWLAQEEGTFGKRDATSMKRRHEALLDLLCAHVPVRPKEEKD